MSVITEILRLEDDGSLSFGNHLVKEKQKLDNFNVSGDIYKVKTHNEVTRLERNSMLMLETVPGAVITGFVLKNDGAVFKASGNGGTQITLGLKPDTKYNVVIDGEPAESKTGASGKLSFGVALTDTPKEIKIETL